MEEPSVTASAIISFAEKLEGDSSGFYEKLARRFVEKRDTFLAYAEESKKNKLLVTRTYQETITDALEACFSFGSLNLTDYLAVTALAEDMTYPVALKMALELEKKASKFYSDVAELSKPFLATIPGAFGKAARVRDNRKLELETLLEGLDVTKHNAEHGQDR